MVKLLQILVCIILLLYLCCIIAQIVYMVCKWIKIIKFYKTRKDV